MPLLRRMPAFSNSVMATLGITFTLLVFVPPIIRLYRTSQSEYRPKKPALGQNEAEPILSQGQEEPIVHEITTWRLFISAEDHSQQDLLKKFLTVEALRIALEKAFRVSLAGSTLQIARQLEQYCATLMMQIAERPFTTEKSFSLELGRPRNDNIRLKVTPDDHFGGITTLYDGTKGEDEGSMKDEKVVDLIAVCGLGGHAFKSFTSSTNPEENWLRDNLPRYLPHVRVLVYGYDTRIVEETSKQSITDIARAFFNSVNAHLIPSPSHHPVILLGHSLGGLVIKEALSIAKSQPSESDLFKACYGLIFFGVPNHGLRHEQLLTMVGSRPNKKLIEDLVVDSDSEASPLLKQLEEKFHDCCKEQDFRIKAFYERKMTNTVQEVVEDKARKWKKSGPKALLVTEVSATSILGQSNSSDYIPLDHDHSSLVRFNNGSDSIYTDLVRPQIKKMVEAAPAAVELRFKSDQYLKQHHHSEHESLRGKVQTDPLR